MVQVVVVVVVLEEVVDPRGDVRANSIVTQRDGLAGGGGECKPKSVLLHVVRGGIVVVLKVGRGGGRAKGIKGTILTVVLLMLLLP